jgi:hypothetical protein
MLQTLTKLLSLFLFVKLGYHEGLDLNLKDYSVNNYKV